VKHSLPFLVSVLNQLTECLIDCPAASARWCSGCSHLWLTSFVCSPMGTCAYQVLTCPSNKGNSQSWVKHLRKQGTSRAYTFVVAGSLLHDDLWRLRLHLCSVVSRMTGSSYKTSSFLIIQFQPLFMTCTFPIFCILRLPCFPIITFLLLMWWNKIHDTSQWYNMRILQ
jgi:hypothetical protein